MPNYKFLLLHFNFDETIILENERVLLRPLELIDVKNLLEVATSDRELIRFSPSYIHTPAYLKEYVHQALELRIQHKRYPFCIFDKKKNAFAGSTSFLDIVEKDERLEIGATWLGKEFQMSGLNRNCKFLLLSYAFEKILFKRVQFLTDERNAASRQAIEKIGGQFEGLLRSHTLMKDGFRRNTVVYSILSSEWPDIKKNLFDKIPEH